MRRVTGVAVVQHTYLSANRPANRMKGPVHHGIGICWQHDGRIKGNSWGQRTGEPTRPWLT